MSSIFKVLSRTLRENEAFQEELAKEILPSRNYFSFCANKVSKVPYFVAYVPYFILALPVNGLFLYIVTLLVDCF